MSKHAKVKKATPGVSYHIRVYDREGFHGQETFRTKDFDDALAEWENECENNPSGGKLSGRVELVEERIVEVQDP